MSSVPDEEAAVRLDRWLTRAALALWLVVTSVGAAYLMAGHLVELPVPQEKAEVDALAETLTARRPAESSGKFVAFHVLYRDCGCSQNVVERLLNESPAAGAVERVVWVGGDATIEPEVRSRGYDFDLVAPDQLQERYGLVAAPVFVVLTPDDRVAYLGGYTSRKRGPQPRHREILAGLMNGLSADDLPVLGCAVGRELAEAIDPWGLRH
ncbi:MAG: hypothetical protein AAGA56_14715 [Myxococcota bacterium]